MYGINAGSPRTHDAAVDRMLSQHDLLRSVRSLTVSAEISNLRLGA